jgi:ATPase family protein associated with various cellular activities (AAA)
VTTLFETSQNQQDIAFPESLTDAYKPRRIADFVGLQKQKMILEKLAANPRGCGLLFYGGPGVGKTSMAFAFARAILAEIHHVPSQECKLETLQSISAMCHRVPYDFQTGTPCKWHCVILDEADLMSSAAQNYLLSKLDGSQPCPSTVWIITSNGIDKFEDRFLSRLIQLPKFNGYGTGEDIRGLLSRIWQDRAPNAAVPDFSRVPTSNVREALQWLEVELLAA